MAKSKKEDVNKTKAIIDYSKANPTHGPTVIVEELKKQGIAVSPQYVSSIRSKAGVAKKRKRRGRKSEAAGAPAAATRSSEVVYTNLMEAKKFVRSVGNLAKAKRVLEALGNLQ